MSRPLPSGKQIDITRPFKKVYTGPMAINLLNASINANRVVSNMRGVKRVFCTIPLNLAAMVPLALFPVAMLVDRIVKPVLKAANRDENFKKYSYSTREKILAFVKIVPKLILTAPLVALTAAVGALALPVIFGAAVVKSFMGKPLFSKG